MVNAAQKFFLVVALAYFSATSAWAELTRFAEVSPGIFRSSRPDTDEDYQKLRDAGIQFILSLQCLPWDVALDRQRAERNGFKFLNVCIEGLPTPPTEKNVNRAIEILASAQYHPIAVHCKFGRDRTGLIVALYRIYFEGVSSKDAWDEMLRFGFKVDWTLWGLHHYFDTHSDAKAYWEKRWSCPQSLGE